MKFVTIVACLSLFVCSAIAAESHFCYRNADGCGPDTGAWPAICHNGLRQSPIALPANLKSTANTKLRLMGAYRNNFFRMQNTGHSVSVDFVGEKGHNEGPTENSFSFPDPLDLNKHRDYKFASLHFHWGVSDTATGSEHCVGSTCSPMEIHFVHYLATYPNMSAALASGDESALSVLGVLVNKDPVISALLPGISHPSLAPLVKNLGKVENAAKHGENIRVNEPIDFTQLIVTENPAHVYTYKGSLTTPDCNEQANWYMIKKPAAIPHHDLEAFRTKLKDSNETILNENHRPLQALHGRQVTLTTTMPTF